MLDCVSSADDNRILANSAAECVLHLRSFGYMISQGATTLWENWHGALPSGAVGSNNHIMFGGNVGTIAYTSFAGLQNAKGSVAWRNISMRPLPAAIEWLGRANASILTPRGLAAISWAKHSQAESHGGRSFAVNVTVPAGSTATLVLPKTIGGSKLIHIKESTLTVWGNGKYMQPPVSAGFIGFTMDTVTLAFTVCSGQYNFMAE